MLIILTVLLLVAVVVAALIGYAHWNTFRPVVRHVETTLDEQLGDKSELRIVQLSDLHMERQSIKPERMAKIIADANADLIVMTGDYLDNYDNLDKFMLYLDEIKKIEPEHGIWLVWGNHDHYLGERIDDLAEEISAKGIRVLANEWGSIEFGAQRLNIIGIDDFCLGKSDIPRSFHGVEDGWNLVLSHDPNVVLHLEEHHKVDLLLSGHLHGGQFKVPGAFKLFPMGELPKQNVISGMHIVNGKNVYISDGMGQAAFNVRLGTRPEITVHTLRAA
ncbi:metallophosphoesterase [Tumebacillus sp. ITR2]|uniref:Metallophosphoesterase n=1 Tax=Tumebacillus amylolyticus TaxID=2801339 RepID=A0ABS1J7F0_9BACL|nr:metallophosphoesterase [Tumebacillus amylolyticus]MBL0386130.1 metallophosphoesterase [Tumebacillus amylolyticus]